jgi:tyrosyl-tRNA synthetase
VTEIVHGVEAAREAEGASAGFTRAPGELSSDELEVLADTMTSVRLPRSEVEGVDLVDLAVRSGLVGSKSEARRLIGQAGLYLNDEAPPQTRPVLADDLLHGRFLMLRRGKKHRCLVVVES